MRVWWEETGEELTLSGAVLGRGEGAAVYAVPGRPGLAAKVRPRPGDDWADRLAAMLAVRPLARSADGHTVVAWPVGRLLGGATNRVVGYLMPRVEGAFPLADFLSPASRRKVCPLFHHGYLLRAARNLAAAVEALHAGGCVAGALGEENLLVSPQALVTLVGADSFQVPGHAGRAFRCRPGRPEDAPPELQGVDPAAWECRREHDAFALAVLVFRLLMQGVHPFAGLHAGGEEAPALGGRIAAGHWPYSWERPGPLRPAPHAPPWEVVPPAVQELLWRCFDEGFVHPEARPGPAEWREAMDEAEHALAACAANGQHIFPRGLDRCPWCAVAREQGRDPFPSAEEVRATQRRQQLARPLPVPGLPQAAAATAGPPESGLGQLGAAVERRPWLVWLAVSLLGGMAGLLWALLHAPPPAEEPPGPPAAVAASGPPTAKSGAGEPGRTEQQELLEEYRRVEARYREAVQAYNRALEDQRRGLRSAPEVASAQRAVRREQSKLKAAHGRLKEKVYGPEER